MHGKRITVIAVCVLAMGAATPKPKGQETPIVMKQELRVAKTAGMESFTVGARFSGRFAQNGETPIVIEAELADGISTQQGNGTISNRKHRAAAHPVYRFRRL